MSREKSQPQINHAIPLPRRERRENIQVEINSDLREAIRKEAKKHQIPMREVVEYGLLVWLMKTNQPEALRLMEEMGIKKKS